MSPRNQAQLEEAVFQILEGEESVRARAQTLPLGLVASLFLPQGRP